MNRLLVKLIHKYQNSKGDNHISTCIYTPCCSDYAIIALEKYNIIIALRLIIIRIYKCDSSKNIGGVDYP